MKRILPVMAAAAFAAGLALAPAAHAITMTLSQFSSEPGDSPASVLDATVDFDITGANEVTITLTNDTGGATSYDMNGLAFNVSDDITSLTLVSATHSVNGDVLSGWDLETAGPTQSTKFDGFGIYDYALLDGTGNSPAQPGPGESVVFVLSITGTGPFDMLDFRELSSQTGEGDANLAYVAAKFVEGPNDFSAYGSSRDEPFVPVPEPTTATLLGTALLLLGASRRRARRSARP
ncbi:MAG: PEP-CTERM sorting domain-containing protein [Thermoanaerobaculia bacterium]|nr:PEP-CTERM sorting domain-containing protein [Thermoanaerobaculia bacterium]